MSNNDAYHARKDCKFLGKSAEWLYKPGYVPLFFKIMAVIIPLDIPLLAASSSLPEATREPRLTTPYLALLRMGFTYACMRYRIQRCALTTPFHPDHRMRWRSSLCGTFLGFPPLDVIQHPVLCSPDFPRYGKHTAITRTTPQGKDYELLLA